MKCPKCNYTSFDFNRTCPKCGNNNTDELTRLNLSQNKPNPPFFLASLMEMEDTANPEIHGDDAHTPLPGAAPEEMETQDLLIALDDLHTDDTGPNSTESLGVSADEIIFDTDDSKEESTAPFDSAEEEILLEPEPASGEDEILFDLEPAAVEDEIETIDKYPLDKKGFPDFDHMDEEPAAVEAVVEPKETANEIDEKDLFLADEPESAATPTEKTESAVIEHTPETEDAPELFLSLDDLPADEPGPDPSASNGEEKDEIVFELEEDPLPEAAPTEEQAPDKEGFWDSDEIEQQVAVFDLEETGNETSDAAAEKTAHEKKEANLFKDMDVEPLDLELSLEDLEEKP